MVSLLDVEQTDIAGFLRAVDAVAGCEPDVDMLRDLLMVAVRAVSGADGAALFEVERDELVCRIGTGACAPMNAVRLPRSETVMGSLPSMSTPVDVDVASRAGSRDTDLCRDLGLSRMLVVPLRRGRRGNGIVLVGFTDSRERKLATDDLLRAVVQIGAARLEHLALANERAARDRMSAAVAEAGRAVLASDHPAQTLCDWARRLTGAPYASFIEPQSPVELGLCAQSGATLPSLTLRLDEPSLAGTAFLTGRAQVVHDYQQHPEVLARVVDVIADAGLAEPRAAAFIPVRTGQETVGVVCLLLNEPFVMQTMTVLGLLSRLAAEAALAIDRDRLRRELEKQASTDALTTVANRRTYVTQLSLELSRAKRSGNPVSLVLVDLDRFKGYNDQHGHQAGDALLRTVSSRWLGQMRETDLLARLGGDEFVVVLPDTTDQAALAVSQRLLDVLPEGVTASAGIAQWDGQEDQLAFYRRCDEALYAAKNAGRNCAKVAT